MLLRWDVENPGAVSVMPTPMPTWDGCGFVDTVSLPTFRTGDVALIGDPLHIPDGDLGGDSGSSPDPVNQAPIATGDSVTTTENTSVSFTLSATDPDGDDNNLVFTVSDPASGTLTGTAPSLTYTPDAGFTGNDGFSFSVSDGTDSVTASVSITVVANDPPPGGGMGGGNGNGNGNGNGGVNGGGVGN